MVSLAALSITMTSYFQRRGQCLTFAIWHTSLCSTCYFTVISVHALYNLILQYNCNRMEPPTCTMSQLWWLVCSVPAHHCMEELIAHFISHFIPGTKTGQAPVDSRATHPPLQLGNSLSMSSFCSPPPGWVAGYRCGCAAPGAVHWAHPQWPLCWSRRGNLHSKFPLHNSSTCTISTT